MSKPRESDRRTPRTRRPRRLALGCASFGCGLPLLALLALLVVYAMNNRIPDLDLHTPALPKNNAYNDFVAAGRMAEAIRHKSPVTMMNPPSSRAQWLAACAACAKDAGPALQVMRRGFGKECVEPTEPIRPPGGTSTRSAIRELERTIRGVCDYYALTHRPYMAAQTALD